MSEYLVVAFYKFVEMTNLKSFQSKLVQFCIDHSILGTILLANEGINGTIAGTTEEIHAVFDFLRSNPQLTDLQGKYSNSPFLPFKKIKVVIKQEIVTMGLPMNNPNQKKGIPVPAEEWNDLISTDDILIIDTRNQYEVALGTFKSAINPETNEFSDFPTFVEKQLDPSKHKKIAMFCTGGIRCEKASAYLIENGFENVYQLQGGILKYLEKIDPQKSLWQGKCFIFDRRTILEKESIQTRIE